MIYFLLVLVFLGFGLAAILFFKLRNQEKEIKKAKNEGRLLEKKFLEEEEKRLIAEARKSILEKENGEHQTKLKSLIVKSERFRLMVEETEAFLFEMNYKGEITYANPSVLHKLGYSEAELLNKNFLDFSTETQKQKLIEFYYAQYQSKKPDTYAEWEVINRFGETFKVGSRVKMEFDTQGKILSVKAISQDLSVIQEARKAIFHKDTEPLFQKIACPFFLFERPEKSKDFQSFQLRWTNKAALHLMNLDWFEVEGLSFNDISEGLLGKTREKLLYPEKEVTWSGKKWPEVTFQVLAYLHESQLFLALFNVSNYLRSQSKAEQERDFFKAIAENSKVDIAIISPEEKYLYVNPMAVKNPEMRQWIIGKTDEAYVKARHQDLKKTFLRKARFDEIRHHLKSIRYEDFNLDSDKNIQYFLREITPFVNEAKELLFFIVYGINLTDRFKRLENQLENADKWSFICRLEELSLLETKPIEKMEAAEKRLLKIISTYYSLGETFQLMSFSKSRKLAAFYLYPTTLSYFKESLQSLAKKWQGLEISFSIPESDLIIYLIPKILIQETLERFSGWSTGNKTKVVIFTGTGSMGASNLFIVIDLSFLTFDYDRKNLFSPVLRMWQEEGFQAQNADGFINLSIPIVNINKEIAEEVSKPIQILQGHRIVLGPAVQKSVDEISEELKANGAEVFMVQNPLGVNRYLEQGNHSLIIWWGTEISELEGLDWSLLQNLGLKLLLLNPLAESKIQKENLPNFVISFSVTGKWFDILEQVWLHSHLSKPIERKEPGSSSVIRLNFDQLLEITEGDKNFIATLVKSYFKSLQECKIQFEQLIENQDLEGIRFLLHKIRATTKTFEIKRLDEVFRLAIEKIESGKSLGKKEKSEFSSQVTRICQDAEIQIIAYCNSHNIQI
jgi:PAS domain S-box-containing protein